MTTRRKFITTSLTSAAAITMLPAVNTFALNSNDYELPASEAPKLRFAIASDAHYAQPDTNYKTDLGNMIGWLNEDHKKNTLNFVIINGDLVHDRPDLLPEVKREYFDKLDCPHYAIPGNHDHADSATWKNIFGYEDNFVIDKGDIGFVLANTSDVKGSMTNGPDNVFLKKSLDAFADKKIVFVVLHIPPCKWVKEDLYFADSPETIKLLHSYPNVKAVFHGHDHQLDGVRYTDKLPHFFDSHIGGNWGTTYKGYRIVEVGFDNSISTYQVNASKNPVINTNKL